jgi:hypothetical protein
MVTRVLYNDILGRSKYNSFTLNLHWLRIRIGQCEIGQIGDRRIIYKERFFE